MVCCRKLYFSILHVYWKDAYFCYNPFLCIFSRKSWTKYNQIFFYDLVVVCYPIEIYQLWASVRFRDYSCFFIYITLIINISCVRPWWGEHTSSRKIWKVKHRTTGEKLDVCPSRLAYIGEALKCGLPTHGGGPDILIFSKNYISVNFEDRDLDFFSKKDNCILQLFKNILMTIHARAYSGVVPN